MFRKSLSLTVIVCFFLTSLSPYPQAHADSILGLPRPGTMINLSPAYEPVIIKGLTIHKDNPFLFDFIVDVGQDKMSGAPLRKEGEKLIKYFLAGLAIPDKDVWVNLSPYEKDRTIPEALGQTDMGRDLLEQDYILKQITASLIYPEKQLGKTFWNKVYAKAQQMYGTTQVPVNTFNKVWIMADRAEVFEHGQTAFVVRQHLKVMLEEDYLALKKHSSSVIAGEAKQSHTFSSQIVRNIILPELEKEVNTGRNFANLRQIFNSIILSSWYKKNLKEALLNQLYTDQSKVKGINLNDPTVKQQIYEQYLKAYKQGVFNYIKEDVSVAGETIPRKYFSGGMEVGAAASPEVTTDAAILARSLPERDLVDFSTGVALSGLTAQKLDAAMRVSTEKTVSFVVGGEEQQFLAFDVVRAVRSLMDNLGNTSWDNLVKLYIAWSSRIDVNKAGELPETAKGQMKGIFNGLAQENPGYINITEEGIDVEKPNAEMKDWLQAKLDEVRDSAMAARKSRLSPQALRVIEDIRKRNPHVAKFVLEQAVKMGARDIEVIGQEDEQRIIQEGLDSGDLIRTVDGNYLGKSHPADVQRVVERTMVATRNPADKGKYNNWRNTQYVLDMVMPKFLNALKGTGKMYVIPYIMEPEGANFDVPSIQVTNSAYVALQSITMAGVGEEAWRTLGKSEKFHKGIHFTGDLDNLRRDPQYRDEYDDRWFVSLPDEGYGMTISYGSNYGGNVLFGKKFEGLRLGSWVAAKDPEGKMAEHMALVEMINLVTGEKKYFAFAAPSNSGKTNFAMMKVPKVFAGKYQMRVISDDLLKIRVGEDGRLYAFNPERGIFGVVTDTNEQTNPNFWHAIGPNTGTIFSNMAYKLNAAGEAELWWKGKTPNFPEDITGWHDWTGKLISDREVTQEAIDEVAKKLKKYEGLTVDQLTSDELNDIKKRMSTWEHPNGRGTTKIQNVPSVSAEFNNPKGVPIDAILFGGRVPTEGFIPPIRMLKDFNQGLYSLMTMFVSSTAAEAGAVGVKRRDPGAMLPFFSLNEIDYFKNWLKIKDKVESKGAQFPSFFQTDWFVQDKDGNFMWPGYEDNMRLLDWAWRMLDGTAKYQDTAVGRVPEITDLNTEGLSISTDTLKRLFTVNLDLWRDETNDSLVYLKSLANDNHPLPQPFIDANQELRRGLGMPLLDAAMTVHALPAVSVEDVIDQLDQRYGFEDLQIGSVEIGIIRDFLQGKRTFKDAVGLLLTSTLMGRNLAESMLGYGEELMRHPLGDKASVAAKVTVDPKLKADFPALFQIKDINGRHLDPLEVIGALTQAGGTEIPVALNARRLLLESQAPARVKYAFPKFTDEFKDGQGQVKTFRQIVQGMIDNFLGINSPDAWRLNDEVPVPNDIFPPARPGLQVTGPSDPLNMAINQLNALLSVRMPDLEDASASWYVPAGAPKEQTVGAFAGIQNESELLGGEWENGRPFVNQTSGKQYKLTQPLDERPATIERLPSIHLLDKHIMVNDQPTPAIDIALALHFLNTHGALKQNGSGNYYYVPKVQTPSEALIVEEKLMKLEELTGLPLGTIKIEALYEEGNAGRWLPVIMWVWRHRLIGMNVGRWDYIGSLIEMWKDEAVFPDPQGINMNSFNLITYQRFNALLNVMVGVKSGEMTNGAAVGGMSAIMLYPPTDAYGRNKNNPKALRSMKIDKLRERLLGLIFVPDQPLAEGQAQPALEDILSGNIKGRLYDAYRQSWVATTDSEYVAAGNGPLRADIKELQSLLDAPEEWTEIEGKRIAPTVSSGLIKAERDLFESPAFKLLNSSGKITPRVISRDRFNKPEDLFNDELWNDLYSVPKGDITIEHIQHAYYMAAQYGFQILNGNYAAAIDDYELGLRFMNDLATYRIFVGWLWTAFHHQAQVTKDGWIKDPELVSDRGVVPNKNVIEIKAGTTLTPAIFDQVWDAHDAWTKAFFADQDSKGAKSTFDRKWADVIMEVLKRQLLSNRYLQHSPRVLFVLAEAGPELRKEILDAIFDLTREQVVTQVQSGTLSQQVLDARDYVFDYYPNPPAADAAMVGDFKERATYSASAIATVISNLRKQYRLHGEGRLAYIEPFLKGNASFDVTFRNFLNEAYPGNQDDRTATEDIKRTLVSVWIGAKYRLSWRETNDLVREYIITGRLPAGRTLADEILQDAKGKYDAINLLAGTADVQASTISFIATAFTPRLLEMLEQAREGAQSGNLEASQVSADLVRQISVVLVGRGVSIDATPAPNGARGETIDRVGDKALIGRPVNGGIDLNTSDGMQWKVSKDGQGVEMNVDQAMIERVRHQGIDWLSPVIFKMTPVSSVWPLVGLQAPEQQGSAAV